MSLNNDTKLYVRDCSLEACRLLNEMLLNSKNNLTDSEFQKLKIAVGKVMGEIGTEILFPIYKERKDLAPDWFEND